MTRFQHMIRHDAMLMMLHDAGEACMLYDAAVDIRY